MIPEIPEALGKWLVKMRQQFLDGTFCDVTIRVTLRQPTSSLDNETSPQPHTLDIPCHANVLSTRSDYFDRALRGGFLENDTKVICITREDEEDLKFFKLLLEQSYAPSYIHDDEGIELDRDIILRLALAANEYEFGGCIDVCVAFLRHGLKLEDEILCLEVELSALQGRECVKAWMKRVIQALAEGGLGPVHQLYNEGPLLKAAAQGKQFYEVVPLKAVIKVLPVEAMKALLGSDNFELQVEDEAYYLLGAWLHQSIHVKAEDRVSIFKSLATKIRFHHISADFLANVVTYCPLARESGLMPSFLRSALVHREANKKAIELTRFHTGALKRETGNKEVTFSTTISLDNVISLEKGERTMRYVGALAGFPMVLALVRDDVKDTLGLFIMPLMPEAYGELFTSCLDRSISLQISIQTSLLTRSLKYRQICDLERGLLDYFFPDFFSKPWKKVVNENSIHFPGKEMPVTVTLKKLTMDD